MCWQRAVLDITALTAEVVGVRYVAHTSAAICCQIQTHIQRAKPSTKTNLEKYSKRWQPSAQRGVQPEFTNSKYGSLPRQTKQASSHRPAAGQPDSTSLYPSAHIHTKPNLSHWYEHKTENSNQNRLLTAFSPIKFVKWFSIKEIWFWWDAIWLPNWPVRSYIWATETVKKSRWKKWDLVLSPSYTLVFWWFISVRYGHGHSWNFYYITVRNLYLIYDISKFAVIIKYYIILKKILCDESQCVNGTKKIFENLLKIFKNVFKIAETLMTKDTILETTRCTYTVSTKIRTKMTRYMRQYWMSEKNCKIFWKSCQIEVVLTYRTNTVIKLKH